MNCFVLTELEPVKLSWQNGVLCFVTFFFIWEDIISTCDIRLSEMCTPSQAVNFEAAQDSTLYWIRSCVTFITSGASCPQPNEFNPHRHKLFTCDKFCYLLRLLLLNSMFRIFTCLSCPRILFSPSPIMISTSNTLVTLHSWDWL